MTKPEVLWAARVKPHRLQPKMAELKGTFVIRNPDGSLPSPAKRPRAALRPVNVIKDSNA